MAGSSEAHRFRFFAEGAGSEGVRLALTGADAEHMRVLRMNDGDIVEVVDTTGSVWSGHVRGASEVKLIVCLAQHGDPSRPIELIAGALIGGRFDELVDGAVQAGASTITPLVGGRRDLERLSARRARLQRIARAAAKQSKRSSLPDVTEPIDADALLAGPAGIIIDPAAPPAAGWGGARLRIRDWRRRAATARRCRRGARRCARVRPRRAWVGAGEAYGINPAGSSLLRRLPVAIAAMHAPPS